MNAEGLADEVLSDRAASAGAFVGGVATPETVAVCDRSGRPVASRVVGGSGTASPGWGASGLPREVLAAVERGCAAAADSGRPGVVVVRVDSGGVGRAVECRFTPLPLPDAAVAVCTRDVTAELRAEESLRESERRYRLLAENATDMISRHDPEGRYLYASAACVPLTGFGARDLEGRSAYDFIHADDRADVRGAHEAMLAADGPVTTAFRFRRKEGAYVWLETTARAVREAETGRVLEIQCSSRDITLRKQAEQELREGRVLFQAVLDNCPAAVYIKDIQGRYLLVNRRFERYYGVSRREAVGRTDGAIFEAPRAEAFRAADRAVLVSGRPVEVEEKVDLPPAAAREGGAAETRSLLAVRFPLDDRDGSAFAVCGVASDVTARRKAEEALRAKSDVLRSILDNMADAVIVSDGGGRFLEFNPAAERLFGLAAADSGPADWSDRYGLFLPDTVTRFPADDLPLTRAMRGELVNDVEMFVRHAGRPEGVWVLINGRPLAGTDGGPRAGVIVCREITEMKSAEARLLEQNVRLREMADLERQAHDALKLAEVQLVQAEKLTALGQVVAGVAHEVNNPLAFVSNNMAVLQRDVAALGDIVRLYRRADPLIEAGSPELAAFLREAAEAFDLTYTLDSLDRLIARSREGLRRIQQIVKDLRDFARPDGGDIETVDLNVGVASTINIIVGRARRQGVEILTELNPLPPVTCHPGKINQVVMNLLANAVDATPSGGKVVVKTSPDDDGSGVRIEVSDTGTGIDPSVRDRIFDPFFTTKPVGQGTGLGLAISYGIVKAHGGTIRVASEPGRGATTFTVRLPTDPPPGGPARDVGDSICFGPPG